MKETGDERRTEKMKDYEKESETEQKAEMMKQRYM